MKKFSRILIMAALLAATSAVTALADGWTQDANGWRYYKNNVPVYNEWQTDANGDYFYLGSDGYMAVNSYVDDDRYVDSTGRMVKNAWRQIDNKWYYFEANGRKVAGKKKLIEDYWYYFEEDGAMHTGWYSDGTDWYYCDPNAGGHMTVSCWKKLEPAEDMNATADIDGDGTFWFYFQSSGRVTRATETEYREASIGGYRFAFDQCGRMKTGWVRLDSNAAPVISGFKYYNDTDQLGVFGAAHTGWLSAYVPEAVSASGEVEWYFFDTKGTPVYGTVVSSNGGDALRASLKTIPKNGVAYSYLFNEKGNPVYGLQRVILDDGTQTSMYFGTKTQSCLQKNVTSITEADGTTWKYLFTTAGYGYTGVKNRYLYYKGKVQKAVDDTMSYYTVNGETYLVNQAGYVLYNYNRSKKAGEVEYRSDSSGRKDGGTAGVSTLIEPEYNDMNG